MSRGPGRIERIVEAAFAGNPDGYITLPSLARLVYPDIWVVGKKHHVAVARAAAKVCARVGWTWKRQRYSFRRGLGTNVYFNRASLASVLLADTRCEWEHKDDDEIPAVLAEQKAKPHFQAWIKPGSGIMWLEVEAFVAERDGREDAAELKAKVDDHYERARKAAANF